MRSNIEAVSVHLPSIRIAPVAGSLTVAIPVDESGKTADRIYVFDLGSGFANVSRVIVGAADVVCDANCPLIGSVGLLVIPSGATHIAAYSAGTGNVSVTPIENS